MATFRRRTVEDVDRDVLGSLQGEGSIKVTDQAVIGLVVPRSYSIDHISHIIDEILLRHDLKAHGISGGRVKRTNRRQIPDHLVG